ncbi:MAG: pantoate--beta-alanine ligase [Coriobacteriia bacterium]|nr:pantoate--beta-alanine ligase [Coriobacteriia bacterium]
MERVVSPAEARQAIAEARREAKTIGLVPTMGALHEGHLALVRASCRRAGYTAVSIFVNPTQFGEGEDFDAYPRDMARDLELLAAEGVDLVFTPGVEHMYPAGSSIAVDPGDLAERWEGAIRPAHFRGVATVVAKLFNITTPDLAFFGEKDYQQLKIVQRMAADLDMAVTVVGCPIVRDQDGVALSSRNAYLTGEEAAQAIALCEALEAAAEAVAWGERDAAAVEQTMAEEVSAFRLVELDYAVVVDPRTLEQVTRIEGPTRALIAVTLGDTRLIDNAALEPPPVRVEDEKDAQEE